MPIDPEELERRAKEARAALSKPRFIPRKERERLAAEKAAKEEAEKKRKLEEQERAHRESKKQWLQEAEAEERRKRDLARRGGNDHKARNGGRDRDSQRDQPVDWQEARDARNSNGNITASNGRKRTAQDIENENLLTRYLGPEVNKHSKFSAAKKRQRTAANKFNFDWDPSEDTTRDDGYDTTAKIKVLKSSGSVVSVGNRFDEAAEQRALTKANAIRELDRETGEERAKGIMEDFYRSREKEEQRLQKSSMGRKWATKSLADMTERDWRIFKEDFAISTKGGALPNPMRSWQESGLSRTLLEIVEKVGYTEPSAIQRAAIPIAMSARDLIGVAHTGSGKTAAFILPMLDYISTLPLLTEVNRDDGPYALILAPTRELAQQIETEALKFAQPLGFNCVSIVGGHSLEEQSHAMRNGAEIVVATPGRLVDCLERRLLVLSQCCYLVMDEADRMIDLGFEESVNKILDALPVSNEKPDTDDAENAQIMKSFAGMSRYRQTMMYTATMPPSLEKIAKKYLRRPATVTIGNIGEAVDTVEQRVEFAGGEDRRKKRLQEILSSGEFQPPMIVFVNIKRNCDAIAHEVRRMGWSTVVLHGSKTQEQREAALQSVRDGHTQVLVATDLAGRGIDVADISLVVNFNMPTSIENYTHRIGRTGRAGKSGVAITLLDGTEDPGILYELKQMLSKSSLSKIPEELKKRAAQPKFPKAGR